MTGRLYDKRRWHGLSRNFLTRELEDWEAP